MKVLAIYKTKMEAEIVKAKLESYGISAIIQSDDLGSWNHALLQTTGGVKLLVAEVAFEEAKALLEDE